MVPFNYNVNCQMVWLNVNGEYFHTTIETLQAATYFQNRDLSRHLEREKAIFIDDQAEVWRHILRLLRDPDYDFPIEYQDVLTKYGIVDASCVTIRDFNTQTRSKSFYGNIFDICSRIPQKDAMTYSSMTGCDYNFWIWQQHYPTTSYISTECLKLDIDHAIGRRADVIREIYLIIPNKITKADLWHLEIKYVIGGNVISTLWASEAILHGDIIEGITHSIVKLPTPYRSGLRLQSLQYHEVRIMISHANGCFQNTPVQLKIVYGFTDSHYRTATAGDCRDYLTLDSYRYEIRGRPKTLLPDDVVYMYWLLDRNATFCLRHKPSDETYVLDTIDTRFLERLKMNLSPLPECQGAVYFQTRMDAVSGSFGVSDDYEVDFGEANGYLVVVSHHMLRDSSGMAGIIC